METTLAEELFPGSVHRAQDNRPVLSDSKGSYFSMFCFPKSRCLICLNVTYGIINKTKIKITSYYQMKTVNIWECILPDCTGKFFFSVKNSVSQTISVKYLTTALSIWMYCWTLRLFLIFSQDKEMNIIVSTACEFILFP